jgi:hypothetical protein
VILSQFVEDQIRIGRRNHSPQAHVAGDLSSLWVLQQEIRNRLDACLRIAGTDRRTLVNVCQYFFEFSGSATV